jgi:hypothetical protein
MGGEESQRAIRWEFRQVEQGMDGKRQVEDGKREGNRCAVRERWNRWGIGVDGQRKGKWDGNEGRAGERWNSL